MKNLKLRFRSTQTLALVSFLALAACATPSSLNDEVVPFENSGNLETVVILGTNDLHGALAPAEMKTKDPHPIEYKKGGAAIFAAHVKVLRQEYGDHLLLLDAGDEFQGSIDSNLEEGRPMVRFFNQLGFNAAAIGNHEFDFGPVGSYGSYDPVKIKGQDLRGTLEARIREANYPYLAANIYNKKTGAFPGVPGTKASIIVRAGNLKVGIIGLTTIDTPTTTRPAYAASLDFRNLAKVALAESKKLREDGADIVVALAHAGVFCNIPLAADRKPRPGLVHSEADFQTGCESNHEIPELLRHVPKGTIDAVVSGHTHTLVHHWIEGVPVIQAGTQDLYYNLIYLTYDRKHKKVLTGRTRIEGPVPICEKVFANQHNCNGDQTPPERGRGALVRPKLRGVAIRPDPAMEAVLAPTFAHTAAKKDEIVGKAARRVAHTREIESPMGDFVADAIRESLGAQIGIMNPGGIRSDWESGEIRYADVFRTLPFDNFLSKLTLTGKELRLLVRITNAGARGFFSTSGLIVRAIRHEDEPYSSDLNKDGKIEPWELDRLIDVKLADGSPIEDGKLYTVGTLDFLVSGGDSLGWFMKRLPKDRVDIMAGPVLRDAVIDHLKTLMRTQPEGINSASHPIVDPDHPHLILEPRAAKQRQKSHTRRHRGRHRRKRHRRK
jgi:5'-nucleotidase